MSDHPNSIGAVLAKVAVMALAWFGSVTLADVQKLVAIFSGLCVGAYAALQFYVLWRDKVKDRK